MPHMQMCVLNCSLVPIHSTPGMNLIELTQSNSKAVPTEKSRIGTWLDHAVKRCSRLSVTVKITHTKFFQQRNTITVFLIQELRFIVILNIILGNCCSKSRSGRSHHTASSGKRRPYGQYSLAVWAEIGKYACHHGVTAPVTASQFSW